MLGRRRVLMASQAEGEDEMKEWKLLDVIDFSVDKEKEYIVDRVTEVFLQAKHLMCEKDASSNMKMEINGVDLGALLTTMKSSGNGGYQYSYSRWNGLFWETRLSMNAISNTNFQFSNQNAQFQYNVLMNVGEATTLRFLSNMGLYPIASGTLEIYVR